MTTEYTLKQVTDVLNNFLTRAYRASGLAYVTDGRWIDPNDLREEHVPSFIYHCDDDGYEYIHGFNHDAGTAFGVGCTLRCEGTLSPLGENKRRFHVEVSWGCGGRNEPDTKILLMQKATEAKLLFESMANEFMDNVTIKKKERVTA